MPSRSVEHPDRQGEGRAEIIVAHQGPQSAVGREPARCVERWARVPFPLRPPPKGVWAKAPGGFLGGLYPPPAAGARRGGGRRAPGRGGGGAPPRRETPGGGRGGKS